MPNVLENEKDKNKNKTLSFNVPEWAVNQLYNIYLATFSVLYPRTVKSAFSFSEFLSGFLVSSLVDLTGKITNTNEVKEIVKYTAPVDDNDDYPLTF